MSAKLHGQIVATLRSSKANITYNTELGLFQMCNEAGEIAAESDSGRELGRIAFNAGAWFVSYNYDLGLDLVAFR
jgi:hypothetical protein